MTDTMNGKLHTSHILLDLCLLYKTSSLTTTHPPHCILVIMVQVSGVLQVEEEAKEPPKNILLKV